MSDGTIDRRRVLQGIAWTTPAVVLAVATPQAAASVGGTRGVLDVNRSVAQREAKIFQVSTGNWQALPTVRVFFELVHRTVSTVNFSSLVMTFRIPKAWTPATPHVAGQPEVVGGGVLADGWTMSAPATSGTDWLFTLVRATGLPLNATTYSQLWIEVLPTASAVGQQILLSAFGTSTETPPGTYIADGIATVLP